MVIAQLRQYVVLDGGLIITSCNIHDIGEKAKGKGGDTLYIDKTIMGDFEEYLRFRRYYQSLDSFSFHALHRAFLLQYARKNPAVFPFEARCIMSDLATNFSMEVLVFEAIERWDYVLYALEQYHDRGNEKILVQTLRHQIEPLNFLARELPGFGDAIWTADIFSWAHQFLVNHEGQWIEQKSAA
jgi:hypothetical protein